MQMKASAVAEQAALLIEAISSGHVKMAGLDTVDGEAVKKDQPLLTAPEDVRRRILFSSHIGGITVSSQSYEMTAEDIRNASEGRVPKRSVTKNNRRIEG
ncbi:MAG: hypothetical protein PUC44_04845 [Eubacteriales bacterium]|nr:hypothetical protein [Eubacteriales bacterium]